MLNDMPKSPELPAFCRFYYFVMFECVCAIAVSCLLISFFHMNVNIDQPEWVKVGRNTCFCFKIFHQWENCLCIPTLFRGAFVRGLIHIRIQRKLSWARDTLGTRTKVFVTGAGRLRECKNEEFVRELRKTGFCEGGRK